jgi:hypothetical protein
MITDKDNRTTRRPGRPQTTTYRIEDMGFRSPCWLWEGSKHKDGYGMVKRGGFHGYAHRLFYSMEKGPVPVGMQLDHLCRVRECCNPNHLEPVTPAVNVRRSALAKLTPTKVAMIRLAWSQRKTVPVTQKELADRFGVTQPQISHVVNWNQWN